MTKQEWKDRALSSEHNVGVLTDISNEYAEALQGWMIDHGHRCRVCMDRSQAALKRAGRYDLLTQYDSCRTV